MSTNKGQSGLGVDEAAEALKAVESAGRRSEALGFSAAAGPQLIVWGLVWAVCNTTVQFGPPWAPIVWLPGVIVGTGLSILLARRAGGGGWDPRRAGTFLILLAFNNAIVLGLGLHDPGQVNLVISLLVACCYMMAGVWRSRYLAWIGLVLGVLVVIGWWGLREWFALWMGLVGGGALLLTGLWMRRL